jgi:hypothetical protein
MSEPFIHSQGIYPYIIHYPPPWDEDPPYPTHTHGLDNIGLPEMIFDPLAFGGKGNGQRINAAFRFFMKPENDHLFQDILAGKVIKLPAAELDPGLDGEPYTYCFREVSAEFEAVKEAYGPEASDPSREMRFIQVWVDGDDFALEDSYYKGGVKC